MEEQADNIVPEGSLAYQARTARFCGAPVSATPAPGTAPRHVYAQSRADYQQPQWPVLPKRLDMMCVASGSALSIATFGLFPLAGLDVSPVANKPAAQSQVSILKVCHDRHTVSAHRPLLCTGSETGHTKHTCILPGVQMPMWVSTCLSLHQICQCVEMFLLCDNGAVPLIACVFQATMTPDLKQLYLLWSESRQGSSSGQYMLHILLYSDVQT